MSTRHFAAATEPAAPWVPGWCRVSRRGTSFLPLLAAQYASGVTALGASQAGWNLAFEYSRAAGLSSADCHDVDAYRAAAAGETALRRQLEIAWACAVAAYELNASDKRRPAWDHLDLAYLQLLQDRANYSPTPWEVERLAAASAEGMEDAEDAP